MLLSAVIFVVVLNVNCVYGIDLFEAFLLRPNCYKRDQEGCSLNFIDKHDDLAWSYDHLTRAETWFFLFTKDNPDEPELLHRCAEHEGYVPPDTKFNSGCKTEIFLPGFVSGVCNYAIFRELKDERLKCGCYNVILLDWMWGNGPDLIEAKANINIVAKQLVILIQGLKKRFGLSADDFILTGHSYGAHMAGLVGQMESIGIINGVEPAGVVFTQKTDLKDRLDRSDADCVHVLHTNGGQCLPDYFGVNFTCGDTDVWFNGGLQQFQSCYKYALISFLKFDFIYALLSLYPAACSHFQALQFYKASMNTKDCQFIGRACKGKGDSRIYRRHNCGDNGQKCAIVGAYGCQCSTENKHRNLCVTTKNYCPYCDNSKLNTTGVTCDIKLPCS